MSVDTGKIKEEVKAYIMDEFLPGEDPAALENDTPLITGGILDSIATVKLVDFLEGTYGVSFQAHEMSADYLDSLDEITKIVQEKI